jgi:hypothetical protein
VVTARQATVSLLFAVALVVSNVATACPFCAAGSPGGTGVRTLILGMMVLPFVVAGVILRAALRTDRDLEVSLEDR